VWVVEGMKKKKKRAQHRNEHTCARFRAQGKLRENCLSDKSHESTQTHTIMDRSLYGEEEREERVEFIHEIRFKERSLSY
jgi:hypothetical protein